jgi:hypothetical protein
MGRKLTAVRNAPGALGRDIAKRPGHYLAGLAFLVLGAFLIVWGTNWKSSHALAADILSEFGIAIWIAVLIAAFIEFHLTEETFRKGVNAIMNRIVPEEVWSEIRQHVIRDPVLRYEWKINMTMESDPNAPDTYISETKFTYYIKSLDDSLHQKTHHGIDHHRVVNLEEPFEKITRQKMKEARSEENSQESTSGQPKSILLIPEDGQEEENVLKNIENRERVSFYLDFTYEKEWWKVEVSFQERVYPRDVINWWMNVATRKITVEVDAPSGLNVELHAHHPEENILGKSTQAETNRKRWETSETAVMLPGQGFELRFSQPTPQAAKSREERAVPAPAAEAHKAS